MAATGLMAKGWFKGRLGGWLGTTAVLTIVLTLLVVVAAIFSGMQAETEERVADVYTGDLRITPSDTGVFSGGTFRPASAEILELGAEATYRMESQFVMRRGSFVSELAGGSVQGCFGGQEDCEDSVALGVMVGYSSPDDQAAKQVQPYLTHGRLATWRDGEPIPVVMSASTLKAFLNDDDWETFGPPSGGLDTRITCDGGSSNRLRFEITAGVFTDDNEDVYREFGCLSGIFETGVDQLDTLTMFAPIEGARLLLGHGAHDDVANVFVVHDNPGRAESRAQGQGWATETSGDFTARYLGQLIQALRTLSLLAVGVLFTVPAFLVAHGVERVLDAQKREVAVLRAIGVPGSTVRSALGRLIVGLVLVALVLAAFLSVGLGILLHGFLPAWDGAPLPLDVQFTWVTVLAAVLLAGLSVMIAFLVAVRGQKRMDICTALRAA